MIVGFTGTRNGMTAAQKREVRGLLRGVHEARHGDCIGSDEDFHKICLSLGIRVVIHPPSDDRLRAFCEDAYRIEEPRPYLDRNHAIVRQCDLLIGTPKEVKEPRPGRGQGTWSTIRFARRVQRPNTVVWPSGKMLRSNLA